ncbi:hypothetical protein N9334_04150 [Luminiphilus sp.]|jgi:hypothetical protein|nr:hypothetical protein [Luminiphilus sp.]MDB2659736.1 hypothetical protein [Luminiphilus sp.]MDB3918995.1 hypothetical protein [Luminiphilus sp.]
MNNRNFIRRFASFSIAMGCVHFVLETLFTVQYGQSLTGLLPDYIAVALLLWGGVSVRGQVHTVGLLCGAWGFTLCLHYRAWAWRFEEVLAGEATAVVETTMHVLSYTAPISILSFGLTLYFCSRAQTREW